MGATVRDNVKIPDTFDPEILRAWGVVELDGPATGGARNTVWFGRLNGRRCVVRRSRRQQEALEWELDIVEALRRHHLGVPVIVPTADAIASSTTFRL